MGVKEKHITTANELWDFAIPGSTNELQDTLFAELYKTQVRNHLAYQSIRWCLQTVDILNGYISIPLIASIENHFQTYGMAQILKNTGLLQVGQNGWSIRNETAETVLHETVQYWPTEELIKFLLQNETIWNLPTLQEKCAKVDMLISLKDESAFCVADSTVKRCEEDGEDRLAERVLRKCRDATQYAISPKLRFRHLCFAYRCLEKSNLLETLPVENRENECTKILFECKLLYENSPTDQTAELLILCNLMKNAMAQNKFHFSEGEPNIDISIKLAIKHNLSKLGALAYVKKAIYTKELYGHQRCFEVFREGIRKYPQDNYLLACYLANYAAYQAKTSLASAIQTASAALHAAHKSDDSELCCWIGADLFMYRLQNGENTNELLSEIKACRQTADQHGYRPDISRTYNLEGVFYQINRNNNLAVKCFRNSIQCFDGTVTDQQKFLFRCNLLSALPTDEEEFKSVFQQQMCWLESNKEWLLKKLQLRSKLSEESNFAALICILDVAQRQRMRNEFDRIKTWFPLETLQNIEYKQRIKLCNLLSGRFTLTTKRVSILF